uniref:Lipocalin/cytosolic fatty-acid binding domain-containing protein n=1 Tax=Riptortus pedestris TaxID=329032 RepID=R4WD67_RIPPE|nr:unknown secreted protein [Riptortus pedestris]
MVVWRIALAVISLTIIGVVESQYTRNICRNIDKKIIVNYRLARGNWFVFGVTPGRLSKCYKYRIEADNENNFHVYEEHLSLLPGVWKNKYDLVFNLWSPEIIMESRLLGIPSFWNKWTLVSADVQLLRYMIVYRCGWFQEEAQIWVRDSNLSLNRGHIPDEIMNAMETLGFKESDFDFKKDWDCLE